MEFIVFLVAVLPVILICLTVIVIVVVGIAVYNNLVKLRVLVEEAWSGIDVQLKKRFDLIPNLVNTVKGYAKHEEGVFTKVTELRSSIGNAESVEERVDLENQLSGTLKTLFAVSENYPELKADSSFLKLQGELSEIEDELEGARRYYNGTVREFNLKIQSFPINLVAGMFGFKSRAFFEAEEEAKENVKVDFN